MIQLPIEIGDVIRVGRFKNKRVTVKDISVDEYGLPLINGRGILKIRIEKLMKPKENIKESLSTMIKRIVREEKQKILKENVFDYLDDAKEEAKRISKEEGVVQHVNGLANGKYKVSDWYDSEETVCSYENGILK